MRDRLASITLKGFKTIQNMEGFKPRPLTILIGPNGVGKSNFISFFRMMSWMLSDPGNLQLYVGQQGGAGKLLHDGSGKTREIEAELTIETYRGDDQYYFRLFFAAGDTLIFAEEKYRSSSNNYDSPMDWTSMGAGHRGPSLLEKAGENTTARVIRDILQRIIVYQFHNTADNARIRGKWGINDNRYLKEDAGNIAPFLYRLKEQESWHYRRIVDHIRLILPFFSDFELVDDYGHMLLAWREQGSDQVFDASQASDGMLRVIALVSLLLQPEDTLPYVLILDEPELGLHPYAIEIMGGLIGAVSKSIQVIVATQSAALVNCFAPEDIVVVEREGRKSVFKHLDPDKLGEWLDEYSLAELWEKNVLGGQP